MNSDTQFAKDYDRRKLLQDEFNSISEEVVKKRERLADLEPNEVTERVSLLNEIESLEDRMSELSNMLHPVRVDVE